MAQSIKTTHRKAVTFLGRVLVKDYKGISFRVPTDYLTNLFDFTNLTDAKPVTTPGTAALKKVTEGATALGPTEHKAYRSIVGKIIWLAPLRPASHTQSKSFRDLYRHRLSKTWPRPNTLHDTFWERETTRYT